MVYWFAVPVGAGEEAVFEMTRVVADAVLLVVSGSLTLKGAVMLAVLVTAQIDGLASSANTAIASVAGNWRRHCATCNTWWVRCDLFFMVCISRQGTVACTSI